MLGTKTESDSGKFSVLGKEIELILKSRGVDDGFKFPDVVNESWRRCIEDYELIPDSVPRAEVLSHSQMHILMEEQEEFLRIAEPEVERLFLRLVDSEYLVSLASRDGTMLLFRCDYQYLGDLARSGVIPGSIWSEQQQGTNGIGTCLAVGKSVAIVGSQHYGTATQALTCLTTPIFGRKGALENVLNVTTARSGDARMNNVVQSIVERTSSRIENTYFGRLHRRSSVLRIVKSIGHGDIADEGRLALDDKGCIIEGTSQISKILGLSVDEIVGSLAEDVLEFEGSLSSVRPDRPVDMIVKGKTLQAVLTLPLEVTSNQWSSIPQAMPNTSKVKSTPIRIVKHQNTTLRMDPILSQEKDRAQRLLATGLPLIITGETGTGKTAIAQSLARQYCGEDGLVISVDCSSLDQSTDINEFLNSLTHAKKSCLILDRVDELVEGQQITVINLIDTSIQQSENPSAIIVTSAMGIDYLSKKGEMRKDLLHRLKGGHFSLGSLRSVPNLEKNIRDFVEIECKNLNRTTLKIDRSAQLVLNNYHWPGNIRELINTLRHAIALVDHDTIQLEHLPNDIVDEFSRKDLTARSQSEASKIEAALRYNNGNVSLTARYLGMSRATLYRKVQIKKARGEDGFNLTKASSK